MSSMLVYQLRTQKLRPPGGSITVFSTVFNKAVLLSYALTLDPYNPMVPPELAEEVTSTFGPHDMGATDVIFKAPTEFSL